MQAWRKYAGLVVIAAFAGLMTWGFEEHRWWLAIFSLVMTGGCILVRLERA